MKILITTDWYRPTINGVVTSVLNLEDGLTALGHDVRILTLSENHHSYQKGNVTFIGSVNAGIVYPNARVRIKRGEPFVKALIDWKPDVVHSQCEFSTFLFAKQIARACGCPLVHTYHTVYEDFTHYFSPNARLGRFLAARFSHYILSRTDAVVVPTGKIQTLLRGYGVTQPISIVPTGLHMDSFLRPTHRDNRDVLRESLGLGKDDFVLIYLGRLAKEKNIGELLHFLPATPERMKLLIVGDGPYRTTLEAEAQSLGLSGRVVFAGMVAPADVAAYYKLGDVFVSASQSETQGLTYFEAMASGLPLLCRVDDCLDGVLIPGETGISYTNEQEFLRGLNTMTPAQCKRMGANARQRILDAFTEETFAQSVLDVYEGCIARSAPATVA